MADQLGVQRTTRVQGRLHLTAAARDYVAAVRPVLASLAQASLTLRASPTGGALNLAILPAVGMYWLAPRLAGFARRHPQVTVNLSTRLPPFDFAHTPFDAAIHDGREDWPGAAYLKLMADEVLAVASPVLTAPLTTPQDAPVLPLLQLQGRPGDWGRWLAAHGAPGTRPPAMLFDQFATMQQAAIHGLSAAILPLFLIEHDLAQNRLIPLYGAAMKDTLYSAAASRAVLRPCFSPVMATPPP